MTVAFLEGSKNTGATTLTGICFTQNMYPFCALTVIPPAIPINHS